ncbi:MAG: N-acetyltransferase family protein [Saprospiraceae bacterium]
MTNDFKIRLIDSTDAAATLEIYRPYVENTIISFEYELPTLKEWETRILTNTAEYPWLVCEYKNEIVGYAYGSKHRYRTAYSWSPESTIYLSDKFHRLGLAKILYETLFALLKLQGYVNVYAGVGLPNAASEEFHLALGFYEIGIFKKVGFKLGAWHDTRWFQLHLIEHPDNPAKPKTPTEVQNTDDFKAILKDANSKLTGKKAIFS